MEDFPANSSKARAMDQPREEVRRVTSAETVRRKRGLGGKFKDTFIGGNARGAVESAFIGVVIPAVRDTLYNALSEGFERLIFGEGPRRGRGGYGPTGPNPYGHVNYGGMSTASRPTPQPQRSISRGARARHDFNDLVVPTHQEAIEVIEQMFEILSKFGMVSVADLFEMCNIHSSHTDMKWGWTDLRGARPRATRNGGYLLALPDPEPLG